MVLVEHMAFDQVGNRLEAPVRMGGETGKVVGRLVRTELIQHQERIKPDQLGLTNGAANTNASSIGRFHSGDHAFDGSGCHREHLEVFERQ